MQWIFASNPTHPPPPRATPTAHHPIRLPTQRPPTLNGAGGILGTLPYLAASTRSRWMPRLILSAVFCVTTLETRYFIIGAFREMRFYD